VYVHGALGSFCLLLAYEVCQSRKKKIGHHLLILGEPTPTTKRAHMSALLLKTSDLYKK
jgi:hypothetical protein